VAEASDAYADNRSHANRRSNAVGSSFLVGMERCGYDCGIFSGGPAAITGFSAPVALLIVAFCVLGIYLFRDPRKAH
jgi:hypothetical protein